MKGSSCPSAFPPSIFSDISPFPKLPCFSPQDMLFQEEEAAIRAVFSGMLFFKIKKKEHVVENLQKHPF